MLDRLRAKRRPPTTEPHPNPRIQIRDYSLLKYGRFALPMRPRRGVRSPLRATGVGVPGNEVRISKRTLVVAIGERGAIKVRDGSAGGFQDRLARRRIPFAGLAKPH